MSVNNTKKDSVKESDIKTTKTDSTQKDVIKDTLKENDAMKTVKILKLAGEQAEKDIKGEKDSDKKSVEYTIDIIDIEKPNFRVAPLEWAGNKIMEPLALDQHNDDKELNHTREFIISFKTDIIKIVGKNKCTKENVIDIYKVIFNRLIKIYILKLKPEHLVNLKVADIRKKESIFLRLCGFDRNIKFNEKQYDEMISSKENFILANIEFVNQSVSNMFKDEKDDTLEIFQHIVDFTFNSVDALSYLQEGLKKRGARFEHIINNVIQSIGNKKIYLFNPTFIDFSDNTSVPDEYLKEENDPTYIGYIGIITSSMYDDCINIKDKQVRKFFLDQGVIQPNEDEKEEIKTLQLNINKKEDKVKDDKKLEMTEEDKKVAKLLEVI